MKVIVIQPDWPLWLTMAGGVLAVTGAALTVGIRRWPALGFAGYAIALPGWCLMGVGREVAHQWPFVAADALFVVATIWRIHVISRTPSVVVRQQIRMQASGEGGRNS